MSDIRLTVAPAPHVRSTTRVPHIMWTVCIALLPALAAGIWFFGPRVLLVVATAVAACVLIEYLGERIFFGRDGSAVRDGSAAVTGLLLAFNLPASIPLWQVCIGALAAIGIAKLAFGGIGKNPFNPALVGRAVMLTSFPASMTSWPVPRGVAGFIDGVSGPTALGVLGEGGVAALRSGAAGAYGHIDLLLGSVGGCIGETSAIAVMIGGVVLVARGHARLIAPLGFLGALALGTGAAWLIRPDLYADPLYHLVAGGAMLAAWFMVTDMTTTPMTRRGTLMFAAGAGLLTALIRLFGALPEGASYSILVMNAFVPIIDRYTKPRRFGRSKR